MKHGCCLLTCTTQAHKTYSHEDTSMYAHVYAHTTHDRTQAQINSLMHVRCPRLHRGMCTDSRRSCCVVARPQHVALTSDTNRATQRRHTLATWLQAVDQAAISSLSTKDMLGGHAGCGRQHCGSYLALCCSCVAHAACGAARVLHSASTPATTVMHCL